MEGWVKIHRKIAKWEWYHKSEMVHLFIHFLILANHKDNKWQGQIVKRGQFITGLDSLNKATGISVQTIRTCINKLKSTGELTNQSTNRFRLITLLNWTDYQLNDDKPTSKLTSPLTYYQQSTNKQLTANKNVKKVKIFMTPTIQEVDDYCQERNNTVDPERFVDFYSSKGWMVGKNKMTDWKSCVRTWEKNNQGTNKGNNVKTFAEMAKEEMQREELYNE